jgi:hypothetical protein
VKLTIDHARAAGHCPSGIKKWFDLHGLDFKAFLREGIDESVIAALDDGFGNQVIEEAHRGGRGR